MRAAVSCRSTVANWWTWLSSKCLLIPRPRMKEKPLSRHAVLMVEDSRWVGGGHRAKPHKCLLSFCLDKSYGTCTHIPLTKACHMAKPLVIGVVSVLYLQGTI